MQFTKSTGKPCRKLAIRGGNVCGSHGGGAPQVKAAAARRLVEAEYTRITGAPRMTDAFGALEDIGGRAMAVVDRLSHLVDELDEVRYEGGVGGHWEQVRSELPMLLAALRQAEGIAGRILSLGLDERRVRLSELQAGVLLAAVEAVVRHKDLALDVPRQARAKELLSLEIAARN